MPLKLVLTLALVVLQLDAGFSGFDAWAIIRDRSPDAADVSVIANLEKFPLDFAGIHGVIFKPFSRNGMAPATRYLEKAMSPRCQLPPSREV